ncbi:MAG: KEOPS complex subunit Cgi121 [Candidatus Hadarchaeales archaeon]
MNPKRNLMKLPHKILELPDHQKFVGVVGCRGAVSAKNLFQTIVEAGKEHGVLLQAFDARAIAGPRHLVHAVTLCLAARERGKNIARTPEIDLLCWVAGEKQIEMAVRKVGVKSKSPIAIVAVGGEIEKITSAMREIFMKSGLRADPEVVEMSQEKVAKIKKIFAITEAELTTSIEKIVLERIALLETLL